MVNNEGLPMSHYTQTVKDIIVPGRDVAVQALRQPASTFKYTSAVCFRKDFAPGGLNDRFRTFPFLELFFRVAAQGEYLNLSQTLVNVRHFEHQARENKGIDSLFALHDVILLEEIHAPFICSEELNKVPQDFWGGWSQEFGISGPFLFETLRHLSSYELDSASVVSAAMLVDNIPNAEILETYVTMIFKLLRQLESLEHWRSSVIEETKGKTQRAYEFGRREMRALCEEEFKSEKCRESSSATR
jgi:hypothetical protein